MFQCRFGTFHFENYLKLNIFLQKKKFVKLGYLISHRFFGSCYANLFSWFLFWLSIFSRENGFRLCTRCLIKDIAAAAHWTIALAGEKINGWKTPFGVVRSCPDSLAPGLVLKRFHNHFDTTFFQSVIHLWETEMAMLAPMVHNDPKNIKNFRLQKLVKWNSRKIFKGYITYLWK